ncbi:CdaR family protein [Oceanihabitans sediminis]|uniref:YbbR-like domain-containing protein n=1 Tax=Oceanihabitans sediminis TaxID=1812012 RepID=A0A368P5L5_9FLAO|nr:YbbR-like domain-containing protein [Oceanihabitans sediminis]MDX1277739.1 YbbR-like domain-containing protein [Oceanihabitans sediminis]MDX1773282.1 YbbR-like domain-containing protein [Oceanihabitans sediminis]RBP32713.1 YbbR-like protein [Oceanihabitans sediminis]RCU57746.1 YbbR-like domain-containing protein [Oceanihabitans sediminis]
MINTIKTKLLSFIRTKKINIFLLFLVLSFGILLLTKLSKSYTNTFTFNIAKTNIPEEQVVLNDSSQVLEITMKAYGFELLQYHLSKPTIKIDFSTDIDQTDSLYIWSKNKGFASLHKQFNKNIELVNIVPDSLWFSYDVYDVKNVPIELVSNISYSPGYNLTDKVVLEPDSIRVIGAKSLLDNIKTIKTDTITLSNVNQNITKRVVLKLEDFDKDLKFSNKETMLSAVVEKYTEGTLPIPVQVINVPIDINLKHFPKSVNVSYYTSLANFNDIHVADFKVVCDYSKLVEGQTSLIPELVKKPEFAKYCKLKQEFVEFIITE